MIGIKVIANSAPVSLRVRSPRRYQREAGLALLLLIASYFFVLMFANMARWELSMTRAGKFAQELLERCKDSTGQLPYSIFNADCGALGRVQYSDSSSPQSFGLWS